MSVYSRRLAHQPLSRKGIAPQGLITVYLFWILFRPYPEYFLGQLGTRLADFSVLWLLILFYFFLPFRFKLSRISWLFLLLFIQMVLSLAYGYFVMDVNLIARDFFEFYRIPYYLLVLNFAYQTRWNNQFLKKYLFQPLLLAGAIIIAFGIAQRFNLLNVNAILTPFYRDQEKLAVLIHHRRIISTLYNPTHYGLFLVWFITFLLNLFLFNRRKWLLIFAGLAGASLWWTGSRTALLVFFAVLLYWIWQLVRLRMLSKTKAALLLIIGALIFFALFNYMILHSDNRYMVDMLKHIQRGQFWQVSSLQLRFEVWQTQLDYVKQSPIMGWGPSKFDIGSVTDNQYLFILRRYGLIGLFLFLSILFRLYRTASVAIARTSQTDPERVVLLTFMGMIVALALASTTGEFAEAIQLSGFFYLMGGIIYRLYTDGQTTQTM